MRKRTLKDWFYLEMVSHRAIDNITQTPKKEVHFFFFSVCYIVFNCFWQFIMFDKKRKKCCETYSFSNWWWFIRPKSFLHSKNCFFFILFLLSDKESFFGICNISGTSERIPVRITCNFSHSILCYLFELKRENMFRDRKISWEIWRCLKYRSSNYGKSLIIVRNFHYTREIVPVKEMFELWEVEL